MKGLVLLLLIFGVKSVFSQVPNFNWAKKIGDSGTDFPRSICADSDGNVYITGGYSGIVNFDVGITNYMLTASGIGDVFIAKYDSTGNLLWARSVGGSSGTRFDTGFSIVVDGFGGVYVAGKFSGTSVDFDPGPGSYYLNEVNNSFDVFVEKLDVNGDFVWANQIGSSSADNAYSLALDDSINVYLAGNINGIADLDPGVGVYNVDPINGNEYLVKMDSSGTFIWGKQFGGNSLGLAPLEVMVGSDKKLYITGCFSSTCDFDPGTNVYSMISEGLTDAYLLKLDLNGNFIWANQIGGAQSEDGISVCADSSGNVYLAGGFGSDSIIVSSTVLYSINSPGANIKDCFIAKYDSLGANIWIKSFGGNDSDLPSSIKFDGLNNLITLGSYKGLADFDPNQSNFLMNAGSNYAIFIQILDSNGDFVWSGQIGNGNDGGTNLGRSISIQGENLYLTGTFQNTIDFDMGSGINNLTCSGVVDVFFEKLNLSTSIGLNELNNYEDLKIFPNPNNGVFNLDLIGKNITNVEIYNALGIKVYSNSGNENLATVNLSLLPGMYTINVLNGKNFYSKRMLVTK